MAYVQTLWNVNSCHCWRSVILKWVTSFAPHYRIQLTFEIPSRLPLHPGWVCDRAITYRRKYNYLRNSVILVINAMNRLLAKRMSELILQSTFASPTKRSRHGQLLEKMLGGRRYQQVIDHIRVSIFANAACGRSETR